MKMTISVVRRLKKKNMLVWVKEHIIKNFATCKSLCNLQELCAAFKEKHRNVNIGFSKFCVLRPKWCVLAGSEMTHSVYVCTSHQNVMLLVDAMDWELIYKDLIKKIVTKLRATNASCIGMNPVLALQLWKNFLFRNSTKMKTMRIYLLSVGHYGSSNIDNLYSQLRRILREFDRCYWWFNKAFLYHKAKDYQFLIQDEI